MRPVTINVNDSRSALNEIQLASHECDITEMSQNFTVSGTVTSTVVLNAGAPTLANTNAVLATLLQILQKGGLNRTT